MFNNFRSCNLVVLNGRLGRDAEKRALTNGTPMITFGVATETIAKGEDGKRAPKTAWHNVAYFGEVAEMASRYLVKGSCVSVIGQISYRKDEKGTVHTSIIAEDVQILFSPKKNEKVAESDQGSVPEDIDLI